MTGQIERDQVMPAQQGGQAIECAGIVEPAMHGQHWWRGWIAPGLRRQGQVAQRDTQLDGHWFTHGRTCAALPDSGQPWQWRSTSLRIAATWSSPALRQAM